MSAPANEVPSIAISTNGAQLGASHATGLFDEVYTAWYGRVLRWVRLLGASPADYEDLAQEVFVIAHRQLCEFDGRNVGGWLYQMARWKVRDYHELSHMKLLAGDRRVPLSDELYEGESETGSGPLEALEAAERCRLLSGVLATLADHKRSAFVLFEVDGCSGEEIAQLQGVPINTVWTRIFSARKQLRTSAFRRELQRLLVA